MTSHYMTDLHQKGFNPPLVASGRHLFFTHAEIRNADLRGIIFKGGFFRVNFMDCDFRGADFEGATIYGDLKRCRFLGARLWDIDIGISYFEECDLTPEMFTKVSWVVQSEVDGIRFGDWLIAEEDQNHRLIEVP